jgi:hypothetical protein
VRPAECFCQLHYHGIVYTGYIATHTFWYIKDSSGRNWIFSAGPQHPLPPFGMLISDVENSSNVGKNHSTDPIYARYNFGPSAAFCWSADTMLQLAQDFHYFQDRTLKYRISGPNSNSYSHALGAQGGLPVTSVGPPRAEGWKYTIDIIDFGMVP